MFLSCSSIFPTFSQHFPIMFHKEQNRNCPKRTRGPSRPGIHREHHGGNGCTGQQQCHWLPPLWVNFITTSRRSPEPWKWWLGYVRIREIIPFYGNYSGEWNIISFAQTIVETWENIRETSSSKCGLWIEYHPTSCGILQLYGMIETTSFGKCSHTFACFCRCYMGILRE